MVYLLCTQIVILFTGVLAIPVHDSGNYIFSKHKLTEKLFNTKWHYYLQKQFYFFTFLILDNIIGDRLPAEYTSLDLVRNGELDWDYVPNDDPAVCNFVGGTCNINCGFGRWDLPFVCDRGQCCIAAKVRAWDNLGIIPTPQGGCKNWQLSWNFSTVLLHLNIQFCHMFLLDWK